MLSGEAPRSRERQRKALVIEQSGLSVEACQAAVRDYWSLLPDSKLLDDGAVTPDVLGLQIVQQAAPLANHFQQSPAGMMVLGMNLEMTRQVVDLLAQNRNLNFGRTRVSGMSLVGSDNLNLLFSRERQTTLRTNPQKSEREK